MMIDISAWFCWNSYFIKNTLLVAVSAEDVIDGRSFVFMQNLGQVVLALFLCLCVGFDVRIWCLF